MTDEEKKKIEDEAKEKAKAEAEALERARDDESKNRKPRRRMPRADESDDYDFGAELAGLEKKLTDKIEDIAKRTGVNKYLIYVPVAILFLAALGSVAGAVVKTIKDRRNVQST